MTPLRRVFSKTSQWTENIYMHILEDYYEAGGASFNSIRGDNEFGEVD